MEERRTKEECERRLSDVCLAHSGFKTDIKNLHSSVNEVKADVKKIFNRTNVVLGGICISCILLALNLIIKTVGGS